jgi:VanZ family protein
MKYKWPILNFIYFCIFLAILFLAYTGNIPKQISVIPGYDIYGHFILYAIPSFLGHQLFKRKWTVWGKLSLPLFPLLFAIFTIAEECIQSLSPQRTFSFLDMIMSLLGIIFGCWLVERKHKINSVE